MLTSTKQLINSALNSSSPQLNPQQLPQVYNNLCSLPQLNSSITHISGLTSPQHNHSLNITLSMFLNFYFPYIEQLSPNSSQPHINLSQQLFNVAQQHINLAQLNSSSTCLNTPLHINLAPQLINCST